MNTPSNQRRTTRTSGGRLALAVLGAALASCSVFAVPATAGCGCEKPPPLPAEIRPRATYAGAPVTLFGPALREGRSYRVEFAAGTAGAQPLVDAVAERRRDLADGDDKVQLAVPVPALPLGPVAVTVWDGAARVMAIGDEAFTVTGAPVALSAEPKRAVVPGYRAGVSRGGVVYVALDLSRVASPLVIRAQLRGYPLRFGADDAVFYNTQGFLMQALDGAMPGLFTLATPHDPADSDVLQYSRHEFNTYFLQHAERQAHAVAGDDPNWHLDGTPHVDHDHLVLAVAATLADGTLPLPGETPAADLIIETFSLFADGLTGVRGVAMESWAGTSSYDSRTLAAGHRGDVLTGGTLTLGAAAWVDGSATAAQFAIARGAAITGERYAPLGPVTTMPIQIPRDITDLRKLRIDNGASYTLTGPTSFRADTLVLNDGGKLVIDNLAGPVTLYVTGAVDISQLAQVTIADPNPEKFALYVIGAGPVRIRQASFFAGVVYAPQAPLTIEAGANFYGAFVGDTVTVKNLSFVRYDEALRGPADALLTQRALWSAAAATATATTQPSPTPTSQPKGIKSSSTAKLR